MLMVTADVHEEASGVPFLLERIGVAVRRKRLQFGDYVCGPETVVERKSARDLHKTIAAGRFWAQIGRLRDAGRWPYLIIEGERLWCGPIDADAVRGACLAASDLGIAVLRTDDAEDTARWLYRLAVRRHANASRDRPLYAQRPGRPRHVPTAEAALSAAPGISVVTARSLLARFGSLKNVVLADPAEWQEVDGVGPDRAAALTSMIHEEWTVNRAH